MTHLPSWRSPVRGDDGLADSAPVEVTRGARAGTWVHVAPWGRRAAAALVDAAVPLTLLVAAAVHLRRSAQERVVGTTTQLETRSDGGFTERTVDVVTTAPTGSAWFLLAVAVASAFVVWVLDEGLLQAGSGQSVGKRLLRVRLVEVATGTPPDGVWTTLRWSAVHSGWVFGIGWWTSSDVAVLGGTAVVLADGADVGGPGAVAGDRRSA